MWKPVGAVLTMVLVINLNMLRAETVVDDLPDLTSGVIPVVQYRHLDAPYSGDDFTPPVYLPQVGEVDYVVWVVNQTGDPLIGDSLVVVVDAILEISGKNIADRVKIKDSDGMTADGKPYFRVPVSGKELPPYGKSQPVTIQVVNPDFLRFYPPVIKVRGTRRSSDKAVTDLVEGLVKKGYLSPEEGKRALDPSLSSESSDTDSTPDSSSSGAP